MINFIELTHYKMLNELHNNRDVKIIIVKTDSNKGYSVIEIDNTITNEQLIEILKDKSEKHIFIREKDYNQLCTKSYIYDTNNDSMR